ncbi:type II toxin-antitoxin system HicA family toxin [Salegentibacter sp. JZCK2]|uniref:type II toxin-antitoxin system HicA family toxin n=1 Tax=Salegentibacter tibetensis TaxID=2873600 RepID=UPI001CC8FD64|nr:type II toxin-antitoxin system HicA family toxin [Salegentibacter tibetensis]MBZ9728712.1 type II toxin-antitoxin system HicA family toxin [Salegentibacter tibetensis]
MSKIEKLVEKFLTIPKDLTWEEFSKVLNHYGYFELKNKGKTGGSRRKFINEKKDRDVIIAHKPHPQNIVKRYIIEQVIEKLDL